MLFMRIDGLQNIDPTRLAGALLQGGPAGLMDAAMGVARGRVEAQAARTLGNVDFSSVAMGALQGIMSGNPLGAVTGLLGATGLDPKSMIGDAIGSFARSIGLGGLADALGLGGKGGSSSGGGGLGGRISEALGRAGDAIGGALSSAKDAIGGALGKIGDAIGSALGGSKADAKADGKSSGKSDGGKSGGKSEGASSGGKK